MIKVVGVEKRGGHRLRIRFSDGSFGEHDFAAMTNDPGPLLDPLRDADYFARVFLDFGALTWPNGFDISPEWLRREMPNGFDISPEWLRREMEAAGELNRDAA